MDQIAAAEFANIIGRFYQTLATRVGDTLHQQIGTISKDQASVLMGDQSRLISYSNTFFSLSDKIAFEGADVYFKKVQDATDEITEAVKHIEKVDKIITISANTIMLAGGIVSANPSMIMGALTQLKSAI